MITLFKLLIFQVYSELKFSFAFGWFVFADKELLLYPARLKTPILKWTMRSTLRIPLLWTEFQSKCLRAIFTTRDTIREYRMSSRPFRMIAFKIVLDCVHAHECSIFQLLLWKILNVFAQLQQPPTFSPCFINLLPKFFQNILKQSPDIIPFLLQICQYLYQTKKRFKKKNKITVLLYSKKLLKS